MKVYSEANMCEQERLGENTARTSFLIELEVLEKESQQQRHLICNTCARTFWRITDSGSVCSVGHPAAGNTQPARGRHTKLLTAGVMNGYQW